MARELTAAAAAAANGAVVRPVLFYEGEFASGTLNLWSGRGTYSWDGKSWTGAGHLLGFGPIGETAELRAVGFEVSLSAEVASILSINLGQARQGLPGRAWLGFIGEETVDSGTAQAGSVDTLTLAAGASATKNAYHDHILRLTSGAGSVQERRVLHYDGTTKIATVADAWRTNALGNSEQFDQVSAATGGWSKSTGVTVTANQALDPNGELTADLVEYDGSGAAGSFRIWQTLAGPITSQVSNGIWLRSDTPTTLRLAFNTGEFVTLDITQEWQKFSGTDGGTSPNQRQHLLYSPNGVNTPFAVYAWGAHSKAGAQLGDYIETPTSSPIVIPDSTTIYSVVNATGLIADPFKCFEGRFDVPDIVDDGSRARLSARYESRLIDLDRARERKYTDQDQRYDYPNDGGMRHVALLQDKPIFWGRLTLEQHRARKAEQRRRSQEALARFNNSSPP